MLLVHKMEKGMETKCGIGKRVKEIICISALSVWKNYYRNSDNLTNKQNSLI